jgi:hypothetical protein
MKTLLVALALSAACVGPAAAGDVMWYLGHSGYDEGHSQVDAFLTTQGATMDVVSTTPMPTLAGYRLLFVLMPGFFNGADFFTGPEKAMLATWLTDANHRVVMVGDWDQFYHGQAVMNDLLAAIGNPIIFAPGAYDIGCGHCAGAMGSPDPTTAGLGHICYGLTPTWDPAHGVPLAYPESPAPGPWVVSNGTDTPCIVGIGDQNAITDPCGYMVSDANTKEFVKRLYTIQCSGKPVETNHSTWGRVKSMYR